MNVPEAELLLRQMLGADKSFREGQWEAIEAAAVRKQRVLVVQRTGWGKSIVYFIATKILRDGGSGPALLISPLLALMRNQIEAARNIGLRPFTIHSENIDEWEEAQAALTRNECDILLISPERLANPDFRSTVLSRIQNSIGLFIVDEAHCISDWGHDFRPDYRRIVRILQLLPAKAPVICTTATANDRVVQDVVAQIQNLQVMRGPLTRASLKLFNIKLSDQSERLAWLAQFVPKLSGSGVIYCLTIPDTRRVAEWLQQNGIAAREYNSEIESAEKLESERMLLANECKALVATVALGMGFDKPDLGFVIHFQRPGSVIAYYQQVGRAGRAMDEAYGILLSGREDDEIQDYFIRSAFPPAEVMSRVLRAVEQTSGVTVNELMSLMNYRRGVIDKALKLLEVDGAVVRDGRTYIRTTNAWQADQVRSYQVTANRRAEVEEIKRYVDHDGCLMEFLARALDDPSPSPCGKCMNCSGRTERQAISQELIHEAIEFLRGDEVVFDARKQWPKAALDEIQTMMPNAVGLTKQRTLSTTIPDEMRPQQGRALCIYGDAGWGRAVADGKYQAKYFSNALAEAAARLIRGRWRPEPFPEWVTCVPSNRQPTLVSDFAKRLAEVLRLPFEPVVAKIRDTEPQKLMENSAQQIRNLLGAFSIEHDILNAPVLLVDDIVDSGWTLTTVGILLRMNGSGPVFPFALARATAGDS
ncbi:MAG TPA: RecQ family ATP-dependent DNA helicase [Pyrinomonadaceae bacterium]|jgi:ATP-dependent DNA helicase RecQ|nr:RecQ family ATP-dependent DNA helicase [Pyrinomonadaceae bacterium]